MRRPRLSTCTSEHAVDGRHKWQDDIDTQGKVGAYLRLHGWRQCYNCHALVDYRRYKKRLKKWRASRAEE
jgi:hypothetical protein